MLGVSFSELIIVCLVAFFVMKPGDIRKVVYWYRYILKKVLELRALAQESIDKINRDLDISEPRKTRAKQGYVIDANHKLKKAHDSNPLPGRRQLR
jgi:Sec-independent protein translocase protein TatA